MKEKVKSSGGRQGDEGVRTVKVQGQGLEMINRSVREMAFCVSLQYAVNKCNERILNLEDA